MVEYRAVEGAPEYRVGTDGSVWSKAPWRFPFAEDDWRKLKPVKKRCGHLQVRIRGRLRLVRSLVLEAFVGPCSVGMEGRFRDGNPANCALSNVFWDRINAGRASTQRRGEDAPGAKLTEEIVREIRRGTTSVPRKVRAARYEVTSACIRQIDLRLTWAHVA